jgi:periplasmic protein TonB
MARAIMLFADDDREDWARWSLAAAIVVAAHAGVIASYLLFAPVEPPGAADAPAVIIDLAPMPVAPESQADLAPGPEMVEAQPMPEPPKLVEAQPVEPLPKLETPAEVLLPMAEPKVEAKPEEEPVETPQQKPVERVEQRTPAPQTTAAPRSERRNAPVARAPNPGSSEARAAIASWRDLLLARLQRAKRYPASAEARRAQGIATLSFSLDRRGRVLSQRIVKSSGHADLDQEVLTMLARAQPLPPFPPAMTQSTVQLSIPIRFSVR